MALAPEVYPPLGPGDGLGEWCTTTRENGEKKIRV